MNMMYKIRPSITLTGETYYLEKEGKEMNIQTANLT